MLTDRYPSVGPVHGTPWAAARRRPLADALTAALTLSVRWTVSGKGAGTKMHDSLSQWLRSQPDGGSPTRQALSGPVLGHGSVLCLGRQSGEHLVPALRQAS